MGGRGGTPQKKVIRIVRRMYDEVPIGPLYEKTVKAMTHYRRLSSLMQRSSRAKQGAIDRRLEALDEEIAERLSELTDLERHALDCWKNGILPGLFEIDVEALMERPYRSIRRVTHDTFEYDVAEKRAADREAKHAEREQKVTDDNEAFWAFVRDPLKSKY